MKYIISGINSQAGGVGRLVGGIVDEVCQFDKDVELVTKLPLRAVVSELSNLRLIKFSINLFHFILSNICFYIKIIHLRNQNILIIHPQSIGFYFFNLLLKKNDVKIFIVDNSFFCIKSYNYMNGYKACFECLGNDCEGAIKNNCKPFPGKFLTRRKAIKYVQLWRRKEISYLVQNENQKKLITLHNNVRSVHTIGLITDDMKRNDSSNSRKIDRKNTIIYHAGPVAAKGILFFLKLSSLNENFDFIVPYTRKSIKKYNPGISSIELNNNIHFIPMTWESGLKEYVESASLVICPSLWSAPIEGALVKSLFFNCQVAVVENEYTYSSELPSEVLHMLPSDPVQANYYLNNSFVGNLKNKEKIEDWRDSYFQKSESFYLRLRNF